MNKTKVLSVCALLVVLLASVAFAALYNQNALLIDKSAKVRRVNIDNLQGFDRHSFQYTRGQIKVVYSEQRETPRIDGSVVLTSWYQRDMPQDYTYNLILNHEVLSTEVDGPITTITTTGTEKYKMQTFKNVPVTITFDSDYLTLAVETPTTSLKNIMIDEE